MDKYAEWMMESILVFTASMIVGTLYLTSIIAIVMWAASYVGAWVVLPMLPVLIHFILWREYTNRGRDK